MASSSQGFAQGGICSSEPSSDSALSALNISMVTCSRGARAAGEKVRGERGVYGERARLDVRAHERAHPRRACARASARACRPPARATAAHARVPSGSGRVRVRARAPVCA
eukprot:2070893-Pleurochrysis_carterae.AAC.1